MDTPPDPKHPADTLDGAMWYAVRAVRHHAAGTAHRLVVRPEASPEKLAELRARVRRRQYRVGCHAVADAMLRHLGDSAPGRRPARPEPPKARPRPRVTATVMPEHPAAHAGLPARP